MHRRSDKKLNRMLDDMEIQHGSFIETARDQYILEGCYCYAANYKGGRNGLGASLWEKDEDLHQDPEDDYDVEAKVFEGSVVVTDSSNPNKDRPSTPANVRRPMILLSRHREKMREGREKKANLNSYVASDIEGTR